MASFRVWPCTTGWPFPFSVSFVCPVTVPRYTFQGRLILGAASPPTKLPAVTRNLNRDFLHCCHTRCPLPCLVSVNQCCGSESVGAVTSLPVGGFNGSQNSQEFKVAIVFFPFFVLFFIFGKGDWINLVVQMSWCTQLMKILNVTVCLFSFTSNAFFFFFF